MKQVRKRLTYANVMSSIAVFLLLGGATAIAAKKIGSNELKANAVTTGKIKKNAVTTAKIKKEAVTTAKIKNGAVTGAKLDLASIGTVGSANNANTVDGQSIHKLNTQSAPGSGNVTVATIAGFTIILTCNTNNADVTITPPSGPGTILFAGGIPAVGANKTTFDWEGNKPGEADPIRVDDLTEGTDASYGISSISLTRTDGPVVSGTLSYDYDAFENSENCIVFGQLVEG